MMNAVNRTRACLIFNLCTLFVIVCIVSIVGNGSYLNFGPSEDLNIIGVRINSWKRWTIVNILIVFISIADTFINEWGMPFITFRIYNPDCIVIKDVGPIELQFLANGMYFCWSVKNLIYTLCYVSQIDFALFRVISGEITSLITIRSLIKEKKFEKKIDEDTSSIHSIQSNVSKLKEKNNANNVNNINNINTEKELLLSYYRKI